MAVITLGTFLGATGEGKESKTRGGKKGLRRVKGKKRESKRKRGKKKGRDEGEDPVLVFLAALHLQ